MIAAQTTGERVFTAVNYLLFGLLCVTMVYPLWYILMFSFSDEANYRSFYLLPQGFTLDVYAKVFDDGRVFTGFRNSAIIVTLGTTISMFLTIFAAFPLSRRYMYGRKAVTSFVIFTMIFNGGIIPTYLVVRAYGMVDTLWALMLPQAVIVYNLLIMRSFFANIPDSLIESAYIDGYNDIGILFRIVLPLSKAVLSAVGLFYAVFIWNGFLPGLIYINDAKKLPLQTVLYNIVKSAQATEAGSNVLAMMPEAIKMATAFLTVLPILLVYPFLQKHFVKGVMLGSIKG
ncbi:MAG: carbohydrate ABC transporter permease [Spirochaetota bacterium]